jgi:acyl carrier protein
MENKNQICFEIVVSTISQYCQEIGKPNDDINESTRLIGANSPFDSSDLVQLIVEIEDRINEKFQTSITLTDEKAMSRSTSPFVNTGSLVKFIIEILN